MKLEAACLSLASWDISASYFSCRPRIRVISSLHSSRSCESDTKHQSASQSRKNQSVCLWDFCLGCAAWVSCDFGQTDSSYIWLKISQYFNDLMHHHDLIHNAPEPKERQQAQNIQAPWKSEWFLQAVLLELSGDRSLVLWSDLTPACSDHSQDLGSWELPKAFAHVYDHASTINNQSI